MTARFSRAAQQSIEFPRKARGHRPRLQLTEYRLNRNSSTSGVLNFGLGGEFSQQARASPLIPRPSTVGAVFWSISWIFAKIFSRGLRELREWAAQDS